MRNDYLALNNGMTIPIMGMGTYSAENDRRTTENAVKMAIKILTEIDFQENVAIFSSLLSVIESSRLSEKTKHASISLGCKKVFEKTSHIIVLNQMIDEKKRFLSLMMGYCHFDTARIYGSEPALGNALNKAISNGSIGRESLFVTSKLWGSHHHDPVSALQQTLNNLGMEYVDMYLVHWPVRLKPWVLNPLPNEEDFEELDMETTWEGMERCLELGLCRGIGVSNFSCAKIQNLLDNASIIPAVNQVEMHPMWSQSKLREFCADYDIHVSAYSALGGPGNFWGSTAVVQNPIIQAIALKHNATPAQVALRWGLSKGVSTIVKSFSKERLKENMGAIDLELEDEDILEIDQIEQSKIMRGECYVNQTSSPYKTIQDLWDGEI